MQEPVAGQANIQHAHRTCTKQQQQQKCSTTSHIHVCIVRRSLHVQRITAMCDRMWLEIQIGNSPFVWFTHKLCTITRRRTKSGLLRWRRSMADTQDEVQFWFVILQIVFFRYFYCSPENHFWFCPRNQLGEWVGNLRAFAYHSFWWPFDGIRMNMIDKEA